MTKILRKYLGEVKNGKLTLENREMFLNNLKQFEGKKIQLTIDRRKKPRSLNQNAYYWGVVIPILSDYFGYEEDEMHEALKWQFLQKKDCPLPTVRSTSDLTTVEFIEYIDQIARWAVIEFSVYVPSPSEEYKFICLPEEK